MLNFIGLSLQPPILVSEYCPRGSLYSVLQEARESPALAEQLTWGLRLRMVCVGGLVCMCVLGRAMLAGKGHAGGAACLGLAAAHGVWGGVVWMCGVRAYVVGQLTCGCA